MCRISDTNATDPSEQSGTLAQRSDGSIPPQGPARAGHCAACFTACMCDCCGPVLVPQCHAVGGNGQNRAPLASPSACAIAVGLCFCPGVKPSEGMVRTVRRLPHRVHVRLLCACACAPGAMQSEEMVRIVRRLHASMTAAFQLHVHVRACAIACMCDCCGPVLVPWVSCSQREWSELCVACRTVCVCDCCEPALAHSAHSPVAPPRQRLSGSARQSAAQTCCQTCRLWPKGPPP